jgi:hypothetical protein
MSKLPQSLISVSPIGVGTPMGESLMSFMIRLSEANQIKLSELIRFISGRAKLQRNTRGHVDNSLLASINSGGEIAMRVLEAIEYYTGLEDLHLLTMYRWITLFSDGILHQERLFAPLDESNYEPLLYAVSPVFWTPEGLPLERYCHGCMHVASVARQGLKIRKCPKCGSELNQYHTINAGKPDKYTTAHQNYNDIDYSVWVAKAVGDMIAYTEDTSAFSFADAFFNHLEYFGLKTAKDAAKALSISHISVGKWLNEGVRPRFDQFLNICYCMRVSPIDFFRENLMQVGSSVELRESPKKTRTAIATSKRRPIDPEKLKAQMLEDYEKKSFVHVPFREYCEKQLKRRDVVIRQYYPELAKQFVAQNKSFETKRIRTTKSGRIAEICEAARICISEDLHVNHKNLRFYLNQPGMLMSQWARDLIKLIKQYGPDEIPKDSIESVLSS